MLGGAGGSEVALALLLLKKEVMPVLVLDRGVGAWCRLLHVDLQGQLTHLRPAALHSHPWFLPSPLSKVGLVHVDVL